MIEIAKEGKLPKNIRQIGQVSGNQKVYLEDYVITYLKQNLGTDETMRVIILYGKKEMVEDELCWFVSGAALAEKDFFMEKTIIDQESWQKVNEIAGRFFPGLSVLGWAIVRNEPTKDIEEQIMRTQKQFFRQDQKLYFEYNTEERFESVYLYEKGKMRLQTGYYIYYDRNECMQNYMVSLRVAERHAEEFEADRATHQFREVCNEKKQEIHRRRSATLMTCVSLVLVMVIMVIGITMLNNYERMQSMEEVLYQISGKIDENIQREAKVPDTTISETNTADTAMTDVAASNPSVATVPDITPGVQDSSESMAAEATDPASTDSATASTDPASAPTDPTPTSVPPDPAPASAPTVPDSMNTDTTISDSTATNGADVQASAPDEGGDRQTTYIIQKGDTLAKICIKYYGNLSNMEMICEINGIEDKDNIFYGQKIVLP